MKLARLLSSGLVGLALSLAVTAGSIYVTVSAAAGNSASTEIAAEATSTAELPPDAQLTGGSAINNGLLDDVQLTAEGSLTAKFSGLGTSSVGLLSAAGLPVTLISVDGTATTSSTDADGVCEFPGLSPGLYTITASGPEGRLSYGLRAVPANPALARIDSDSETRRVSISGTSAQLDFVLTPGRDAEEIDRVVGDVEVAPVEGIHGTLPEQATLQTAYTASDDFSESFDRAPGALRLNADGSLNGQVTMYDPKTGDLTAVEDLNVKFITDGDVVASTAVNPDGSFVQWNLLPGIYSMIVAGKDGIGYMGIEVVDDLAQVNQRGLAIPTALQTGDGASIGVVQGAGAGGDGTGQSGASGDEGSGNDEGALPFAGAAAGAGGGGSGGGGPGGGGGLSELLGLAALGLAAAAFSDDDGGGVASPAF